MAKPEIINSDVVLAGIDSVEPHPKNARKHSEVIRDSIAEHGFYGHVLVQRSTGYILVGNGRWRAMKHLGSDVIPVMFVDVDDMTAEGIVLVDNRSSDQATYDERMRAALLESYRDRRLDRELEPFEGSGYSEAEAEDLLEAARRRAVEKREALVADPLETNGGATPADPVSKPGEVYELGPHTLVCGGWGNDAGTDVSVRPGTIDLLVLSDPNPHVTVFGSALAWGAERLADAGCFYGFAPSGPRLVEYLSEVEACDVRIAETLVWLMDKRNLSGSDYNERHEEIIYGYPGLTGGEGQKMLYGYRGADHYFCGDQSQDSVWLCARAEDVDGRRPSPPVELMIRMLVNSSRQGDLVVEMFGLTGSTLMACERLGRQCLTFESRPEYCDLIRQRYAEFTGNKEFAP